MPAPNGSITRRRPRRHSAGLIVGGVIASAGLFDGLARMFGDGMIAAIVMVLAMVTVAPTLFSDQAGRRPS